MPLSPLLLALAKSAGTQALIVARLICCHPAGGAATATVSPAAGAVAAVVAGPGVAGPGATGAGVAGPGAAGDIGAGAAPVSGCCGASGCNAGVAGAIPPSSGAT